MYCAEGQWYRGEGICVCQYWSTTLNEQHNSECRSVLGGLLLSSVNNMLVISNQIQYFFWSICSYCNWRWPTSDDGVEPQSYHYEERGWWGNISVSIIGKEVLQIDDVCNFNDRRSKVMMIITGTTLVLKGEHDIQSLSIYTRLVCRHSSKWRDDMFVFVWCLIGMVIQHCEQTGRTYVYVRIKTWRISSHIQMR